MGEVGRFKAEAGAEQEEGQTKIRRKSTERRETRILEEGEQED